MSKKSNTAVKTAALALSAFLLFGANVRPAQGVDWNTSVTLDGNENPVAVSGTVTSKSINVTANGIVINGSDNATFSGTHISVNNTVTSITMNDITVTDAVGVVTKPSNEFPGAAGTLLINGGANSTFTLTGTSLVLSNNTLDYRPENENTYYGFGGAIGSGQHLIVNVDTLKATGNSVKVASRYGFGGAIGSSFGNLSINGKSMEFSNNTVAGSGTGHARGGAIATQDGNDITLTATDSILFAANSATSPADKQVRGGAIQTGNNITIKGGTIAFTGNFVKGSGEADRVHGGAIYAQNDVDITGTTITFDGNKAEVEADNALRAIGGAIYTEKSLTISGTAVSFTNNSISVTNTSSSGVSATNTSALGGAIQAGSLTITATESLTVTGNSATYSVATVPSGQQAPGAALGGGFRVINDVTITGGAVTFANNTLSVKNGLEADGAAIYSRNGGVTISGSTITFSGNSTSGSSKSALAAAIAAEKDVLLTATESIALSGNTADNDAAICSFGGNVKLAAPNVEITDNAAQRELTGHAVIEASGDIEIGTDTTETILLSGNTLAIADDEKGTLWAENGEVRLTTAQTGTMTFGGKHDGLYSGKGIKLTGGKLEIATDGTADAPVFTSKGDVSLAVASLKTPSLLLDEAKTKTANLFTVSTSGNLAIGTSGAKVTLNADTSAIEKDGTQKSLAFMTVKGSPAYTNGTDAVNYNFDVSGYKNGSVKTEAVDGTTSLLYLSAAFDKTTWDDSAQNTWTEGGSVDGNEFHRGNDIEFSGEGAEVKVEGEVAPNDVEISKGSYTFGGSGSIVTNQMNVKGDGTAVTFATPVTIHFTLTIDGSSAAKFAELTANPDTKISVTADAILELASVYNGIYNIFGKLILAGGHCYLDELTANSGAELEIEPNLYKVGAFTAKEGSSTISKADAYKTTDYLLNGQGTGTANLEKGAKLTITGVSAAGKYTILSQFKEITANGWQGSDLVVTGHDKDDVKTEVETAEDGSKNYVFTVTSGGSGSSEASDTWRGNADVAVMANNVVRQVTDITGIAHDGVYRGARKSLWANAWRTQSRLYDHGLDGKQHAYGLVLGGNLLRDENKTFGLAAHIGKGETDGKGSREGERSESKFWGLLAYGRYSKGRLLMTGDAGFNWFKTDYSAANGSTSDNAKAKMFSVGARFYYDAAGKGRDSGISVMPFVGLRYNHYSQDSFTYTNGDMSDSYSLDQFLLPIGVRFEWNGRKSKTGWSMKPAVELAYQRTFGDIDVNTRVRPKGATGDSFVTPMGDKNAFVGKISLGGKKNNFSWAVNTGARLGSNQKDWAVGATFKWDL